MRFKNLLIIKLLILFNLFLINISSLIIIIFMRHLSLLQKDIKTLEKAVYSGSVEVK